MRIEVKIDKEISGSFKYIGILSKQSKRPSGLGRLIKTRESFSIQEGFFIDGKRSGLFRILDDCDKTYS